MYIASFRRFLTKKKIFLFLFLFLALLYCYYNFYPLPKINHAQYGPNTKVQMEIIKVILASGGKYTCKVRGWVGLFKDQHLVHVCSNTYYSCYGIPFMHTIYRNHDTDFDEQFILATVQSRVDGIDFNLNKIEQLYKQKPQLFKTVTIDEYRNLHFLAYFKTLDHIRITPFPSISNWKPIADASPRRLALQSEQCDWRILPKYDFSLLKNCTSLTIEGANITREQYLEILHNAKLRHLELNIDFVEPKGDQNAESVND